MTSPPWGDCVAVAILRASFLRMARPETAMESMEQVVSLCKRRGFIFPVQ